MINLSLERDTKKYVKAVLDVAIKKNVEDSLIADMQRLKIMFTDIFKNTATSEEYQALYKKFSVLSKRKQSEILKNILVDLGASKLTKDFISILLQGNKIHLVRKIVMDWDFLYLDYKKHHKIKVVSAVALSSTQLEKLKTHLNDLLGSEFYLVQKVNKEILGGLILHINNKIYDDSLKSKIEKIKTIM